MMAPQPWLLPCTMGKYMLEMVSIKFLISFACYTLLYRVFVNIYIYFGIAGDSRAVLVHKGGRVTAMSIDHHPDR